jgi:hypothetical protein
MYFCSRWEKDLGEPSGASLRLASDHSRSQPDTIACSYIVTMSTENMLLPLIRNFILPTCRNIKLFIAILQVQYFVCIYSTLIIYTTSYISARKARVLLIVNMDASKHILNLDMSHL